VLYLDTPENGETVGDCGVAFRPNVDDLAAKTLTLIRDSDLRSELGRRARERAQKTYTWEEVTQKYEDVFFEVLGKEPSRDIPTSSSI
jgi:glycosyltransferase involved in cell wall biosynthesis